MSQKIAVVTGGTGGLGISMCQAMCDQGHKVIATYYPSDEMKAYAEDKQASLQTSGYDITLYPLDVTDFAGCQAFVSQREEDLGPIDILVNNAGITRDAPIKRMEADQWQAVIDTNLSSVFNMSKLVFEGMCERGWGRIVNISSLNGEKGQFGQANYAAAKAGIYGFTRSIAQEGARKGVTVNAISPGYIDTPMVRQVPEKVLNSIIEGIPVGRLGQPEEIARAVAFLTDEASGFITGTNLSINGGQYMS